MIIPTWRGVLECVCSSPQFKDSTLSVESFTAAMAECNNSDHLTELHTCLQAEISRLQKRGTTGTHTYPSPSLSYFTHLLSPSDADQQRLSALESLLSSVSQQEGAEVSFLLHTHGHSSDLTASL